MSSCHSTGDTIDPRKKVRFRLIQALVAGLFGIALIRLAWTPWEPDLASQVGQWFGLAIGCLTLGMMIFAGSPFYKGAWQALHRRSANPVWCLYL